MTSTIFKSPHKLGRAFLPICSCNDRVTTLDESDNVKVLVARRCELS